MKTLWLWLLVFVTNCASLGSDDKKLQNDFKITDSSHEEKPQVIARSHSGVADYSLNKQAYKAEWRVCAVDGAKSTVLVVDRDQTATDAAAFCKNWLAQTFLTANYAVISVNPPGVGRSTGKDDFSGPLAQAGILAGVSGAKATVKGLPSLTGAWAYAGGVPAAAFAAKKLNTLRWAVFGGGIYDAEVTVNTTQDKALKSTMSSVILGDEGYESRSIAWDHGGLPKKIILYHGKNDQAVYPAQAESFRDSLATAEYDVSLQVINGVNHVIPPTHHRQILEVVLKSLQ